MSEEGSTGLRVDSTASMEVNRRGQIFEEGWKSLDHQPRLDAWDKHSDLVHWENLGGADGEGGGRGDRDGEHM